MTALLPNPFDLDPTLITSESNSAVLNPSIAEQATDTETVARPASVATPFTPDELFIAKLYAEIVGVPDDEPLPLFLRQPSPAFMQALIEMGGGR